MQKSYQIFDNRFCGRMHVVVVFSLIPCKFANEKFAHSLLLCSTSTELLSSAVAEQVGEKILSHLTVVQPLAATVYACRALHLRFPPGGTLSAVAPVCQHLRSAIFVIKIIALRSFCRVQLGSTLFHHFTLLHFTSLHFTSLHKNCTNFALIYLLHQTSSILFYFTLLYFTLLYFTLLYFTLLYFTYFTLPYFDSFICFLVSLQFVKYLCCFRCFAIFLKYHFKSLTRLC
jgi:hypothetical protein